MENAPDERLFEPSRLKRSFSEAVAQLAPLYQDTLKSFRDKPLGTRLLYSAAAVGLGGAAWLGANEMGNAAVAIQTLGFGGYLLSLTAKRLEHNRHTVALASLSTGIVATHKALLGAWSYALMGVIASTRAATLSMMPDDPAFQKHRVKTGFAFAAVGIPAIVAVGYFDSWWSLLNMGAMCGGITADVLTSGGNKASDKSRYARLCRLGANTLNLTYGLVYSGSWPGIVFDSIAVENMRQSIREYDMPRQAKDGGKLTLREKWREYAGSILHGKPLEGITPHGMKNAPPPP